jgi:hypothetical protein
LALTDQVISIQQELAAYKLQMVVGEKGLESPVLNKNDDDDILGDTPGKVTV